MFRVVKGSKASNLFCLVPPEIVSVEPQDNVEVLIGGNTTLKCNADGNPPPKYRWLQLKPNQV